MPADPELLARIVAVGIIAFVLVLIIKKLLQDMRRPGISRGIITPKPMAAMDWRHGQKRALREASAGGSATPLDGGRQMRLNSANSFTNPANGYTEDIGLPFLWCLLFGCFYLGYKGAWGHALLAFVLALATRGLSWLIYPFFAAAIVRTVYLRRGWVPSGR